VLEVIRRFEEGQLSAAEALSEFETIARGLQQEDRAHEHSGLNERAYGVLKILKSLASSGSTGTAEPGVAEAGPAYSGEGPEALLTDLARKIDATYASDDLAPAGWHRKNQLRKELRQRVRHLSFEAGLADVKIVAGRVEEYALRHYVRVT
jgi:type I restriction enzyme, R subunit